MGRGTGPSGEKIAAACPGLDSQDLATILDPLRTIFVDLGPGRQISAVETGQASSVEPRQVLKSQIICLALNRQKWSEMGPEWSPGPENRAPGMPRPFPSLCDGSCSPKSATSKNCLFGVSRWGYKMSQFRKRPSYGLSLPSEWPNPHCLFNSNTLLQPAQDGSQLQWNGPKVPLAVRRAAAGSGRGSRGPRLLVDRI